MAGGVTTVAMTVLFGTATARVLEVTIGGKGVSPIAKATTPEPRPAPSLAVTLLDCCLSLGGWSGARSEWVLVGVGILKEVYLGEGVVGTGLYSSGVMVAHGPPCPATSEETGDGTGLDKSDKEEDNGSNKGGGLGWWSALSAPVVEETEGCLGWS